MSKKWRRAISDDDEARDLAAIIGLCDLERQVWRERLKEWALAIRADEREKCAISCEVHAVSVFGPNNGTPWSAAHECAAAIRRGGNAKAAG